MMGCWVGGSVGRARERCAVVERAFSAAET